MKSKTCSKYGAISLLQQLCFSLSVEHRHKSFFYELKARILQLGLERLDFKLNTSEQPDVLLEIQTELVNDFPKVFSGPHAARRLYYARQLIIQQHRNQQSQRGLANKRSQRMDKEDVVDDVLDLTADDSSILSSVPAQRPAMAPNASASHPSASLSQVNTGKSGPVPPDRIHHFLKSCSPPLGYLVSQFVNLGFRTVDILTEVACQWTPDERLELLKKLQVPQGGQVSELELLVLERRFQKYRLEMLASM